MCVRQGSRVVRASKRSGRKRLSTQKRGLLEVCSLQDSRIFQTEVTEQGANEPEASGGGGHRAREGAAAAGKIAPQQVKERRAPTLGLRGPPGEPYSL